MDWDPDTAMDEEAAVQAEIERRRRAREAALKRGIGAATPTIQALQASERAASTPVSRQSTPGPQRADGTTPLSSKHSPHPNQAHLPLIAPRRWPLLARPLSQQSSGSHVARRVQLC